MNITASSQVFRIGEGQLDLWSNYRIGDNLYNDNTRQWNNGLSLIQNFKIFEFPFILNISINDNMRTQYYLNTIYIKYNSTLYTQEVLNKINYTNLKIFSENLMREEIRDKAHKNLILLNDLKIEEQLKQNDSICNELMKRLKENYFNENDSISRQIEELRNKKKILEDLKQKKDRADSILKATSETTRVIYCERRISDYSSKRQLYREAGIKGTKMIFSQVEEMDIGKFYFLKPPFVSEFANVTGVSLKYLSGNIILGGIYGKLNDMFYDEDKIKGVLTGFRGKNSSVDLYNINVSKNSININNILASDIRLSIANKVNTIISIAGSQRNMLNNIVYFYEGAAVSESSYEDYYLNIIKQSKSFRYTTGYAISNIVEFNELYKNNVTSMEYRYVSDEYYSSLAPYLIKDFHQLALNWKQQFLNRRVFAIVRLNGGVSDKSYQNSSNIKQYSVFSLLSFRGLKGIEQYSISWLYGKKISDYKTYDYYHLNGQYIFELYQSCIENTLTAGLVQHNNQYKYTGGYKVLIKIGRIKPFAGADIIIFKDKNLLYYSGIRYDYKRISSIFQGQYYEEKYGKTYEIKFSVLFNFNKNLNVEGGIDYAYNDLKLPVFVRKGNTLIINIRTNILW